MPTSAHSQRKINAFLNNVLMLDPRGLAQQYLIAGEILLEIEDVEEARITRGLLAAMDAIGKVKFPDIWEATRDNAGITQEAEAG